MSITSGGENQGSSTRPYLLRALHEWCTDNGFTPYIAVHVDSRVQVPMEYVKNQEIVLNVGFEATSGLKLGNDFIEFKARFGGTPRDIVVPVDHVVAIYARENGQGMAFPMPADTGAAAPEPAAGAAGARPPTPLRGLRLASAGGAESGEAAADGAPPGAAQGVPADEPPPPDAPPPGGTRPALKRVK
jgi:stringent starvation protein B